MKKSFVSSMAFPEFPLWDKMKTKKSIFSFDFEITARCNLNCRHCYINLPVSDKAAREKELSLNEIRPIVDQAVSLGAIWCLITGGEPLLRRDFFDIYLYLKKKGLFLSIFTNATLISDEHIRFFKKYPPRDIEVTVYGASQKTYETVSRIPGSFKSFMNGLDLLLSHGIKVKLKAMAMRTNLHELPEIALLCKEKSNADFRFDPFLHLRYDGNLQRNSEIESERLAPKEIAELEKGDPDRFKFLLDHCQDFVVPEFSKTTCNHIFHCGAGLQNFTLSFDGSFRLCSSLCHPECVYDLKTGTLDDAWRNFVPKVRELKTERAEIKKKCRKCPIINLCMWCGAHAYLEKRELDAFIEYFCQVAHARLTNIKKRT